MEEYKNTKSEYLRVANKINATIKKNYEGKLFTVNPECKVISSIDTVDGYAIEINNDLFELAEVYGSVAESIFYTDEFVWVVDDKDFYLKEISPTRFAIVSE